VTLASASTDTRRIVRFTREDCTPGTAAIAVSTVEMQAAQCAAGSDSINRPLDGFAIAASACAEGVTTQAGQAAMPGRSTSISCGAIGSAMVMAQPFTNRSIRCRNAVPSSDFASTCSIHFPGCSAAFAR